MADILLLYVTFGSQSSAEDMVENMIMEKLIACGNIHNSNSMYFWDSQLVKEAETVAIMKTLPSRELACREYIIEHHTYDLPCVLSLKTRSSTEYKDWVKSLVG